MFYIISKQMLEEFGNNRAAVIEYIKEAYCLRSEVIGLIIR